MFFASSHSLRHDTPSKSCWNDCLAARRGACLHVETYVVRTAASLRTTAVAEFCHFVHTTCSMYSCLVGLWRRHQAVDRRTSRPPEYRQLDDIAGEPAEFEWRDLPRTHNSSTTRRGSSSWRCPKRLTRTNKIQLPYQPMQNYFWKDVGLSSDQGTKKNGTGLCPSSLAGNGTQQQKQ